MWSLIEALGMLVERGRRLPMDVACYAYACCCSIAFSGNHYTQYVE